MIDLQELDRKLDEILENETSQTLDNWLLNHQIEEIMASFGDGTFDALECHSFSATFAAHHHFSRPKQVSQQRNFVDPGDFKLAA